MTTKCAFEPLLLNIEKIIENVRRKEHLSKVGRFDEQRSSMERKSCSSRPKTARTLDNERS